ncbi:sugar porter family MFS transporter [Poriferisphaera sp. WC338]|uniref:sugar porter family MFS transporter n=1 Tax=Poriferisphaera sp. WC338 TaxID=3425129 RepID=UPI003D81AC43
MPRAFCYVFRAVLVVGGLAGVVYGYDLAVISGALLFLQTQFDLSASVAGFVTSSLLIGGLIGAAGAGVIADWIGRKYSNLLAMLFTLIGTFVTVIAPSVEWLIIGRLIMGVGIGSLTVVVPLYIAELSPPMYRGTFVTVFQLATTFGIMMAYAVDTGFASEGAWRWMFGVNLFPAVLAVILLFFVPVSPRWLITKNREKHAVPILQRSIGRVDVDDVVREIKTDIDTLRSGAFRDLFKRPVFKATVIGVLLMFIQQISGINTVIYYAPIIFQDAGFASDTAALVATTTVGVVNFMMTLVAVFLVDKWGRRPLLLLGVSLMALCLAVLGLAFYLNTAISQYDLTHSISNSVTAGHTAVANAGEASDILKQQSQVLSMGASWLSYVTIACVLVFISSFAFSLGPICFVVVSEIFPSHVRSKAIGLALAANWIGNIIVAQTFLVLIRGLGEASTFWLYCVINIGAWVFILIFVPETKGQSLEAIEAKWLLKKQHR